VDNVTGEEKGTDERDRGHEPDDAERNPEYLEWRVAQCKARVSGDVERVRKDDIPRAG
jgi:hypothetical protein